MECGICYGYVKHCRTILKAPILSFDAIGIHTPEGVSYIRLEWFTSSLIGWPVSTVYSRISLVRMYFRFLFLSGDIKEPITEKLSGGLTPRRRTKLPTVWQEDEINKFLGSIDLTNPDGKCNYTMLLLAARSGLHIGGIQELKLSDIGWQACTLTIIQNETKEPLILPVPDDAGWAVIDYLKNGRPVTESKNVFVRHVPPYNSFTITSSLHNIITRALSDVGIAYRGKPSGFHTLRYSLTTHLFQGGVESSTTSDILDHTSLGTVRHYLQVDLKDLRKYALEAEVRPYVRE